MPSLLADPGMTNECRQFWLSQRRDHLTHVLIPFPFTHSLPFSPPLPPLAGRLLEEFLFVKGPRQGKGVPGLQHNCSVTFSDS